MWDSADELQVCMTERKNKILAKQLHALGESKGYSGGIETA